MGLLIVGVTKLQNGLYPRDVDSQCGYSNSEGTVEQCILTCVSTRVNVGCCKNGNIEFLGKFVCV